MKYHRLDGVDRNGDPIRIEDEEARRPWLKRMHLVGKARLDRDITEYS